MSNLLDILQETGDPDPSKLGKILDLAEEEVVAELETLRSEGTLLGWVPLLHPSKKESNLVRAVIEVKISPEREGGFDRLAHRISKFEDVEDEGDTGTPNDLLSIVSSYTFAFLEQQFENKFILISFNN